MGTPRSRLTWRTLYWRSSGNDDREPVGGGTVGERLPGLQVDGLRPRPRRPSRPSRITLVSSESGEGSVRSPRNTCRTDDRLERLGHRRRAGRSSGAGATRGCPARARASTPAAGRSDGSFRMPCHGIASCGTPSGAVSWTNVIGSDAMSVAVLANLHDRRPAEPVLEEGQARRSRPGGSRGCRPAAPRCPAGPADPRARRSPSAGRSVRYVSSNPRRWMPDTGEVVRRRTVRSRSWPS